jgi:hypothetical protein
MTVPPVQLSPFQYRCCPLVQGSGYHPGVGRPTVEGSGEPVGAAPHPTSPPWCCPSVISSSPASFAFATAKFAQPT